MTVYKVFDCVVCCCDQTINHVKDLCFFSLFLFSKLFVWFVAVISLCGISILGNLVLIYLACNQATRRAVWAYRKGEQELLFSGDDDDDTL